MKLIVIYIYLLGLWACSTTQSNQQVYGSANPVDHGIWTTLLQKHVNEKGNVNYKGFVEDKAELEKYLNLLTTNKPTMDWSEAAQLAYWINVYNAFTIQLITDHYPIASIKDIKKGIPFVNTVWDIKFIEFEDETIDLNKVEHGILRKQFDEPRIHFAINCASFSCPRLLNEAFTAENLEKQLSFMTKDFLHDTEKNHIGENQLQLSKIFNWFKGDFTKNSSLIEFLNQYAPTEINAKATISYLDYDWTLNE